MEDFLPVKSRLPELERKNNVEPYQVYESLGMTKQQYSGYRTNRKKPTLVTAKKLAEYFGVPVDDLHIWRKVSPARGRQKTE